MYERCRRRVLRAFVGVVLTVTACSGWVVAQNSYALDERQVTIAGGADPLQAILATPQDGTRHGLVIFVHGDGPINASHDGYYRPIWESLAQSGFASLSWDKPGVDGAPGHWLDQTMDDRAREVQAALAWARSQPRIDPDRIGLWGASQAGWVLPKVARTDPRLRFVIAVSPAINWLRQGRYNTVAEMRQRGASPTDIDSELRREDVTLRLLRADATFAQAQEADAAEGFTAERWQFVERNFLSDASADLAATHVPTLLLLGGHDVNVDVADTEAGYRASLPDGDLLSVRHFHDATHDLVPAAVENNPVVLAAVALAAPRKLYSRGVLDAIRDFAHAHAPPELEGNHR